MMLIITPHSKHFYHQTLAEYRENSHKVSRTLKKQSFCRENEVSCNACSPQMTSQTLHLSGNRRQQVIPRHRLIKSLWNKVGTVGEQLAYEVNDAEKHSLSIKERREALNRRRARSLRYLSPQRGGRQSLNGEGLKHSVKQRKDNS